MIAITPPPPYYAVIFTSIRTEGDHGYDRIAERMLELAKDQDGFLGVESSRNEIGITVSYWRDLESIKKWKEHPEHILARANGRASWYKSYKTRISRVESDYDFFR
jgi:heme-degrading monooxygenase HmoA